jgi:integrase/recombinase XerD
MKTQLKIHLDRGRSLNLSPLTLRATRYNLTKFINWLAARRITAPDQLRRAHLNAWTMHLQEHRTCRGLPLKPKSINKQLDNLRGFLKHLAAEGLISTALPEAVESVKEPKLLPGSVMNHRQMKKLLQSIHTNGADGYRDRAMLEMLYSTGIRAGELLGLDIAHLDLKNSTAMVTGKGRKQRIVPIGKTALRYTQNYITAVRPFMQRNKTEQALFLNADGKRLAYQALRRLIHRYAKAADIKINVTPHTFRRSCTTELLRADANMYHVKELLGHESLDTLKHYAKLTINDLRATHKKCHPRERRDCD